MIVTSTLECWERGRTLKPEGFLSLGSKKRRKDGIQANRIQRAMPIRQAWSPLTTPCLVPLVGGYSVPCTLHNTCRNVCCCSSSEKTDNWLDGVSSKQRNKETVTELQSYEPLLQPLWLGCWERGILESGKKELWPGGEYIWNKITSSHFDQSLPPNTEFPRFLSDWNAINRRSTTMIVIYTYIILHQALAPPVSLTSAWTNISLKEQRNKPTALTGVAHSDWQRTWSWGRVWKLSRRSSVTAYSSLQGLFYTVWFGCPGKRTLCLKQK